MTTNLLTPTASPAVYQDQRANFGSWKDEGVHLWAVFRGNEAGLETSQWDIGDWIVRGMEHFEREKVYEQAEQIFKFDEEYLQTVVWVVKRFPDSSLRKETNLKWSHFKELAYIKDAKLRESVLKHFNDGGDWSVRAVREHVREELDKLKGQNSGKRPKAASKHWVSMQVSLKENYRDRIKHLARAEDKAPDELLGQIVMEYFEEHKKDIATRIEKAKKKKAKR
jgi:hypothetical protein